ncbi:uncharacterized protein MYCFIDRAFT_54870 [Pseudocercospora fijiensis CIRAD86]|uniref:Uncharacterized protein n=1 Tax=Pseudocercospora fijiensis (strain CIRAD86) TaxID=383855 RepID=N1Q677_PSEFD|nr:uncharacterized protein MYCFIDRAFT_54870 [Pseudocercospora fijiensis CIRAD86]EME87755.1 hypothetical protein MYCFIDRAFT_54870 [Pseudocercospora fijiensis CIRAD86]
MSLAILPSAPMTSYSQSSTPTRLAPPSSQAERPRLSLDTNNVTTTFGKSSTSLRLDSAASPTAKNTFRNAFHPARQSPASRLSKPTVEQTSTHIPRTQSPEALATEAHEATPPIYSASSSASISSTSTIDSLPPDIPYKLSYSVTSILVNSPIPRPKARRTMFAQSKPMFPAVKRVSFKTPLTEEVKNVNFTMRHSDIESSTSTISTLELSPPEDSSMEQCDDNTIPQKCTGQEVSSPQTGDKRESSEEEDSDSTPQTPGPSGRRKRHRRWVWTLDPIEAKAPATGSSEDSKVDEREQRKA